MLPNVYSYFVCCCDDLYVKPFFLLWHFILLLQQQQKQRTENILQMSIIKTNRQYFPQRFLFCIAFFSIQFFFLCICLFRINFFRQHFYIVIKIMVMMVAMREHRRDAIVILGCIIIPNQFQPIAFF